MKTVNYETLTEMVKHKKEAYLLSQVTFEPSVIIERTAALMQTFMELYLDANEERQRLSDDILRRPEIVTALFDTIYLNIKEVEAMLLECQTYLDEENPSKEKISA